MPTTLYVRDVPDGLHSVLSGRAAREGMSLRRYVLGVLAEHAALPTLDEWFDGLGRVPPSTPATSGAQAVRAARESEDEEILAAVAGR